MKLNECNQLMNLIFKIVNMTATYISSMLTAQTQNVSDYFIGRLYDVDDVIQLHFLNIM